MRFSGVHLPVLLVRLFNMYWILVLGYPFIVLTIPSTNFYLKSKRLQTFFASSKMAKFSFGLPILALEGVLGDPLVQKASEKALSLL